MSRLGETLFGRTPTGRRGAVRASGPLPIQGVVDVDMPLSTLWQAFVDVPGWPSWNRCIWRARVREGAPSLDATLVWAFNPIKPYLLYKLPATAEIVEFEPQARVTWEVTAPGFHALHAYGFAATGADRCRFGSWEVADGPTYRGARRFWLAHFLSRVARGRPAAVATPIAPHARLLSLKDPLAEQDVIAGSEQRTGAARAFPLPAGCSAGARTSPRRRPHVVQDGQHASAVPVRPRPPLQATSTRSIAARRQRSTRACWASVGSAGQPPVWPAQPPPGDGRRSCALQVQRVLRQRPGR